MNDEPMHILLIEDNPGDARLIREMIRELNSQFTLHAFNTLADGLAALHDQVFDLILLDLSLPDSFGVETVELACAKAPNLPIVVLTGSNDEHNGIQSVQAGAQDYLIKDETNSYILGRALRYALERHRTEAALRRSEEEYRSLINDVFNIATVGVLLLDKNFNVVWVNEATEIYFNVRREELLGQDKRHLIESKLKCVFELPDDYAQAVLNTYLKNDFTTHLECHVIAGENREERWLDHWSQRINDGMYAGGRIEYYTDITQRKQIESAEREKSRGLAAHEERQRLARELHDSVTQTLFTASVVAESSLRQWNANPEKARILVEQLHQLTQGALAEMRVLLLELRPAALTKVQFGELVAQFIRSLSSRRLINFHVALDSVPTLPPDTQISLYRILQEALNNVVKHADARNVMIRLWIDDACLHLLIEDDGRGFNRETLNGASHGMSIMNERADEIGAALITDSQPGNGTRVQVMWQLQSA